MANIQLTMISGSGVLPKQVGLNAIILCDASNLNGNTYQWLLESKPETSTAYFSNPIGATTKLKNIDIEGVYNFYVISDQGAYNQKIVYSAISVPGSISPLPLPEEPLYDTGGRVRNFSFELPGLLPGYADSWTIKDDGNILDNYAGSQRGRIMPINFVMHSGKYVMCLGDDLQAAATLTANQEFSISQDIDFRDISVLKVELKFIPAV